MIGNDKPVASEPGEVVTVGGDWYDFDSKYTAGGMELRVPAPIEPAQLERVRRIATDAFRESGCAGLARVDFFVTDDGRVLLNELNTMPGFTETSVFAKLFAASGHRLRGAAGPAAGPRAGAPRARGRIPVLTRRTAYR